MTVVMISQRASTIKTRTRILAAVLDDGQQCGFGTSRALLEAAGFYREICVRGTL